jgi:hypothetical protein
MQGNTLRQDLSVSLSRGPLSMGGTVYIVDRMMETRRSAVRYLVSRFFRNSPELLVLNLLKDEELSERELGRIRS